MIMTNNDILAIETSRRGRPRLEERQRTVCVRMSDRELNEVRKRTGCLSNGIALAAFIRKNLFK